MGLRGGVQTVDSIGGHRNGGIETKGVVGGVNVIINGLRHAHYRHAVIRKPLCALEGTFTTDGDKGVYPGIRHVGLNLVKAGLELIRMQAAGAQDGAAAQQNTVDFRIVIKIAAAVFHQAHPAVFITYNGISKFIGRGTHYRTDYSIEAGAIAAGR